MLDSPEDRPPTTDQPTADELNALPVGTTFGALEVVRTLGVGGFGIVYLAQDHALQRLVAVKEYMPGQLAQRGSGSQVSLRTSDDQDTFELGRRSFVNEARLLARFDHRSLLKVYQFWEANGTAYMAMPFLQGQTLKQVRKAMVGPPDDAFVLKVLLPLLDGLSLLHAESVYHRDIAPDNILLPDGGGDPILLDFGAARHAIGDRTQMFTAILKPSFAPIEQYGESASLRQGPWTDLFALGAVAHYLITGRTPPAATTRVVSDSYQPLVEMTRLGLSRHLLSAVDWALQVKPEDRPQSVAEMRAALTGEKPAPVRAVKPPVPEEPVHHDENGPAFQPTVQMSTMPGQLADLPLPKTMPFDRARRAGAAARGRLWRSGRDATRSDMFRSGSPKDGTHWLGTAMLFGGAAVVAIAAAGFWWSSRTPHADGVELQGAPAVDGAAASSATPMAAPSQPTMAAPTTPGGKAGGEAAGELPVVRMSPPPAGSDKPIVREVSPGKAPVRDLSIPASALEGGSSAADPKPLPVSRVPAGDESPAVVAAGTADPRAACGKKVFLALALCIDRLCRDSTYSNHRECVRLRDLRDQRDQQRQH
ncbi:protein kinase [Ideonella sp. DXS29W]|uniref:Protein kinase n=1 Tax=Ideonella lacteola TaxID=2984193 RepID=A0ABU9BWV2_9BURK